MRPTGWMSFYCEQTIGQLIARANGCLAYLVFDVRQEAVPRTRDDTDVQHPELRGKEVKVDGLGSRPQSPVGLQVTTPKISRIHLV